MARQALIKLRRGSGLPANNSLEEGELAIDISAKRLYSANSSGIAFSLSGDSYNLEQGGNSTQATITLTVDNDSLSNDTITIVGGTDVTVAGNSSQVTINDSSTLSSVTGRGATTSDAVGFGNTTITGFANVTTDLHVGTTSQFDGAITVGNSTVNAVISAAGNIDTDGTLIVAGDITAASDVDITGEANTSTLRVRSTSNFDGAITVGNSTVNAVIASSGNIDTDGTLTVGGTTTLNSALTVNDQATITTALTVGNSTVNVAISGSTGDINADGNIDAGGNLTVAGTANLATSAEVGTTLDVGGVANFNDTTQASSTSSGAVVIDGGVGIAKNLYVGGNLFVEGTTTQVSSTTVTIDDNLIKLAANQGASGDDIDAVDAGWYMTYDVANTQYYSGVVRDTSDSNKAFVFFEGVTSEPSSTVTYTSSDLAYIVAIIDGGTY